MFMKVLLYCDVKLQAVKLRRAQVASQGINNIKDLFGNVATKPFLLRWCCAVLGASKELFTKLPHQSCRYGNNGISVGSLTRCFCLFRIGRKSGKPELELWQLKHHFSVTAWSPLVKVCWQSFIYQEVNVSLEIGNLIIKIHIQDSFWQQRRCVGNCGSSAFKVKV
jgi:hypothetical protein